MRDSVNIGLVAPLDPELLILNEAKNDLDLKLLRSTCEEVESNLSKSFMSSSTSFYEFWRLGGYEIDVLL